MVIGVGVAAMTLIFIGVLGGQTYQTVESDIDAIAYHTEVNESFTAAETYVQLGHYPIYNGTWVVYNGTSFTDNTTSFLVNETSGTLRIKDGDAQLSGSTCYIVYDYYNYTISTYTKEGVISSFLAIKQTGNYLPIVVLAVIITIILGMIVGLAGDNRFRTGGNYGGGAL